MLTMLVTVIGVFLTARYIFSWWTIVPVSEAHVVATSRGKLVVSSDEKIGQSKSYFNIPSFIPFIGRVRRVISIEIQEIIIPNLETYEKQQARFAVTASTKYRVKDVKVAAETFTKKAELEQQLKEVIESSVRVVTIKHDVNEARAKKKEIEEEIKAEMDDDFAKWGLELISFQLVDFQDTPASKIISNISTRREADIESSTRIEVAEKMKLARMKEAEANENATKREIEAKQMIDVREQEKQIAVQNITKDTEEKRFDVVKVQALRQQDIDRERAVILANQQKETTAIMREQKRLEGEGERLRLEEIAKGEAAKIREELFAEADGKEKLQEALGKFSDTAIRAMIAQDVVKKDQAIGVETAKALSVADVKVFAGDDKQGFDIGKLISGMRVADSSSSDAVLNRIARPMDLGINLNTRDQRADTPEIPLEEIKDIVSGEVNQRVADAVSSAYQSDKHDVSEEYIKKIANDAIREFVSGNRKRGGGY